MSDIEESVMGLPPIGTKIKARRAADEYTVGVFVGVDETKDKPRPIMQDEHGRYRGFSEYVLYDEKREEEVARIAHQMLDGEDQINPYRLAGAIYDAVHSGGSE